MSFRQEAVRLAHQAGGSHKTRDARQGALSRLADHLQAKNIQIKSIDHLKARHVQGFVESRKAEGIGVRTIHNDLSALRGVLRLAGREKMAEQISNAALGVTGGCRDGTKLAISPARLEELNARVGAKDAGVAAVVRLEAALGLRAEEGVKGCKSLSTWLRQLEAGQPLRVIFGTKGGRPRDVSPADRPRALEAVSAALALAKRQGGVLVVKPCERQAMDRYSYVMRSCGFTGHESGHAIRYAFAQDQLRHYLRDGYTWREACALTSMDLGHGDGRGRYIAQVYGQGFGLE